MLEAAGPAVDEQEAWAAPFADAGVGSPAGSLVGAVQALEAAVEALAGVDLAGEDDRAVGDAALALQGLADRLAGQQLQLLGAVDRREVYALDGAVTTASWYRYRTRVDAHTAARRVEAARRLEHLPLLRQALDAGRVTLGHVLAVTRATPPRRLPAIAAAEPILVQLAQAAPPRTLRVALRRIADLVDPDGAEAAPLDEGGADERRHLDLWRGVDGLIEIRGLLDQIAGETLLTAMNALETLDPAGTAKDQRRSAGQRRADALGMLARRVLDAGEVPVVAGNKPHLLLTVDLASLLTDHQRARLGPDGLAGLTPDHLTTLLPDLLPGHLADLLPGHLADLLPGHPADLLPGHPAGSGNRTSGTAARGTPDIAVTGRPGSPLTELCGEDMPLLGRNRHDRTGDCGDSGDIGDIADPGVGGGGRGGSAQHPLRGPWLRFTGELGLQRARRLALQAKVTALLTMGPWRIVNVGRTMRTLPPWLRTVLEIIHRSCRGPDCDRPAIWAQAHHQRPWAEGGETDVNRMIPVCTAHHDLITTGRWQAIFNPDTGTCTWTSPHGTTITTHPPPH